MAADSGRDPCSGYQQVTSGARTAATAVVGGSALAVLGSQSTPRSHTRYIILILTFVPQFYTCILMNLGFLLHFGWRDF